MVVLASWILVAIGFERERVCVILNDLNELRTDAR